MHPDPRLDVVVAMAVGRELQAEPAIAHGVVVGDGALLLDAEDVVERAGEGDEGEPSPSAGIAKRALWSGR